MIDGAAISGAGGPAGPAGGEGGAEAAGALAGAGTDGSGDGAVSVARSDFGAGSAFTFSGRTFSVGKAMAIGPGELATVGGEPVDPVASAAAA